MSLRRQDLPLLLAAEPGAGMYPLDRIRMQKAIFLLTQRGPEAWRTLYLYEPYHWGPYSGALTSDLDTLVHAEALTVEPKPHSRYGGYAATSGAFERISIAKEEMSQRELAFIDRVRDYVTSKSFNTLLKEVYAEYPEYATRSQFNRD